MVPEAPWLVWTALAVLGAWLAADENSLAQTWFSQPLPAALLAGLICGDPAAAVLPGVLMQLVVLGNLPVGGSFSLDPSSAAVGTAGGAVLAGWRPMADPLATASWTGATAEAIGGLVAMFVVASLLAGRLVRLERQVRMRWMLDGYRSVRDGDVTRLERLHGRCLAVTVARGAVVTLALAVVIAAAAPLVPERLPATVREPLGLLPLMAPGLAVSSLIARFGPRRAWPLVLAGAAAGLLLVRGALGGVW